MTAATEALRDISGLAVDGEVSDEEFDAFSSEALQQSAFPTLAYSVIVPDTSSLRSRSVSTSRCVTPRDAAASVRSPAATNTWW